jgi:hypothetical protein
VCPGDCGCVGCPVWCVSCGGVVRVALRGLPGVYELLSGVSVIRGCPTDVVRVSGSRERMSPSVAVDLQDEMFWSVCGWENDLRRFLRLGAAHDGPSRVVTLGAAVQTLDRLFDRMLSRADCGAVFGRQIMELFGRALRVARNGPLRSLLRFPCSYCGVRALVQQEGLPNRPWYTSCEQRLGGCGRLFTEQEMEWQTAVRVVIQQ